MVVAAALAALGAAGQVGAARAQWPGQTASEQPGLTRPASAQPARPSTPRPPTPATTPPPRPAGTPAPAVRPEIEPGPGLPKSGAVTLVARGVIPATLTDASGLSERLGSGTPHNRLGAMGSSIAYAGSGVNYLMLADRGAFDGAEAYRTRVQLARLTMAQGWTQRLGAGWVQELRFELLGTTLLVDGAGASLLGKSDEIGPPGSVRRLDPEGLALLADRRMVIADEYGPHLLVFGAAGRLERSIAVPGAMAVARPSADAAQELRENTSGRAPNRGFEGVAVSGDGSVALAVLQGPLIQDGGAQGRYVRLLEVPLGPGDVAGGGAAPAGPAGAGVGERAGAAQGPGVGGVQYVYPLDEPGMLLTEAVWLGPGRYLVLEGDALPGAESRGKRVYVVETGGATDVTGLDRLDEGLMGRGGPGGAPVRPVRKLRLLDLLDPAWGLEASQVPAKIEGMTLGPKLDAARRTLVITSDNDFKADEPTRVWMFALPASLVPEPTRFTAPLVAQFGVTPPEAPRRGGRPAQGRPQPRP